MRERVSERKRERENTEYRNIYSMRHHMCLLDAFFISYVICFSNFHNYACCLCLVRELPTSLLLMTWLSLLIVVAAAKSLSPSCCYKVNFLHLAATKLTSPSCCYKVDIPILLLQSWIPHFAKSWYPHLATSNLISSILLLQSQNHRLAAT